MNVQAVRWTWSDHLAALVDKLNPFCGTGAIKTEIEAGRMQAWHVLAERVSLGCFITRIDARYDGEKDLALLFTVAELEAKTAISSVMYKLLEEIALENGIKYIRIHPDRPALCRIVEKAGFNFLESVYIKEVKP